jgi:hypothetical protein
LTPFHSKTFKRKYNSNVAIDNTTIGGPHESI